MPYLQKPTVEDFKTEEEFQDAVDIATLRKQKPELYHFEDIAPMDSRVYPNDKFKFLDDPVTWAGHDQYYEAAIKERNAQLEQYHPSDWSLDHDHRITWAGMVKMADEKSGCLDRWEIFEKPENKEKINIGFKRPKLEEIKTKLTEQQKRDIKVAILKGEHEIDSNILLKTLSLEKMNLLSNCERHYNILSDQFGPEVFFDSVIPFGINFNQNGFFMGNEIEACDLLEEPKFEIEATENDLFTLVISSLDSNYLLDQSNNEVLHYGISNIKKIVTNKGHSFSFNRWAHYLPPIPAKGSGYHRLVATLYKQTEAIDIPELESQDSLSERSFSSRNFLIQNQNVLTPGAYAFSQVKWDRSVQSTFHKRLQMPEPVYQYDQKDVFPIQRAEGIPSKVELDVVKTWFNLDEPQYPIRTKNPTKKKKIGMVNYNLLQPSYYNDWKGGQ